MSVKKLQESRPQSDQDNRQQRFKPCQGGGYNGENTRGKYSLIDQLFCNSSTVFHALDMFIENILKTTSRDHRRMIVSNTEISNWVFHVYPSLIMLVFES